MDKRVQIRMSDDLHEALRQMRRDDPDLPTLAEVIRRILEKAAIEAGQLTKSGQRPRKKA